VSSDTLFIKENQASTGLMRHPKVSVWKGIGDAYINFCRKVLLEFLKSEVIKDQILAWPL
jgi:hypothetical protein